MKMQYLSKEIEAAAKRTKREEKSLVKTVRSCGIFQDYGNMANSAENEKRTSRDSI